LALLFLGDLAKARSEFELALNSSDVESDSGERSLWDAGAACRASLAQASWYSGDLPPRASIDQGGNWLWPRALPPSEHRLRALGQNLY
jgi:hypothetical protein